MENLPQKKEKLLLEAILEKSSKVELIKQFSSLSVEKIVSNKMPSIGALKRTHGASTIENCVGVLIEDLNGSFGGDLSQSQMEELIAEITTGFNQNISLEGVYLAFKEVKYTQNFGKLNVNKVLKIVADQLDKACNYAGVLSHNKHLAIKESCSDVERNSVINKAANKMAKEMYDAGKLKTIKPIKK